MAMQKPLMRLLQPWGSLIEPSEVGEHRMDELRRDSSSAATKARQMNLNLLDEGDRLTREINQHLQPYKADSEHHPSVDVSNLREATIELGRLIAWSSELIAAQSLVSYRAAIRQDMAVIQQKHALVGRAPGRDPELDGTVKAFVERVGILKDSLEGLSWD